MAAVRPIKHTHTRGAFALPTYLMCSTLLFSAFKYFRFVLFNLLWNWSYASQPGRSHCVVMNEVLAIGEGGGWMCDGFEQPQNLLPQIPLRKNNNTTPATRANKAKMALQYLHTYRSRKNNINKCRMARVHRVHILNMISKLKPLFIFNNFNVNYIFYLAFQLYFFV